MFEALSKEGPPMTFHQVQELERKIGQLGSVLAQQKGSTGSSDPENQHKGEQPCESDQTP